MENRNELSDIVLEKGDNKTVKVKRILILVAFLILVFLVALASMKILNNDQKKDTSKLVLPPEPTTQEAPVPKDEQLFKQVPIIEENPKKESFEDMIKTLKEKEAQKQEDTKVKDTPLPPEPAKVEAPKVVEPKVKADTTPKKEVPKAKEVPTASATANTGLYIQVGAVTSAPSKKVLEDIKTHGYEYRLYDTVINGKNITKILIGPFAKPSDAEAAMGNIRANINKNAFVYRVK
ncbi:MAG: SPOR domain-containing protein [Sulfurospirillaceae bacterium]|nr:SPOR domain-containing protein [Sulfurospirillaceae bacterium]